MNDRPTDGFGVIVEMATDAIITIDDGGRILYANPETERMFGYSRDELLGSPLSTLIPERLQERYRASMSQVGRPDERHPRRRHYDVPARHKSGREIPVDVSYSEFTEGDQRRFIGIIRDISDRRSAEETIYRLAAIVESSDDAIISKSLDGTILTWNHGAEMTYGYTPEEIVGRSTLILFPEDQRDKIPDVLRRIARGERIDHYETAGLRKDGRRISVSLTISPLVDNEGKITGASTIARDITERVQAEMRERELESHKLEFYHRTILAATGGRLDLCERGAIERSSGPMVAAWDVETPEALQPVRHAIEEQAVRSGMSEGRIWRFVLAAGEALTNAIKHAGAGTVRLHSTDSSLTLIIADHGKGIEALNLPSIALTPGYSTAGTLGMGYKAMISFADKIHLCTDESGTTVGIEMMLHDEPEQASRETLVGTALYEPGALA